MNDDDMSFEDTLELLAKMTEATAGRVNVTIDPDFLREVAAELRTLRAEKGPRRPRKTPQ